MRRSTTLSLLAGLLGSALLHAGVAGGWGAMTNPPSVWTTLPVKYWVNSAGARDVGGFDPTVTACEASFDTWENNECTAWKVAYQGSTGNQPYDSNDGKEVLGWEESRWPWDGNAIGVTQCMLGSGRIWSADIAFNAVNYTWSLTGGYGSTVDVQSIVTHETGHFLGLNDLYSCASDPQTMCGYYSGGMGPRTLTADDAAGVCALYPGSGPPPGCQNSTECDDKYECVDGDCVGRMCAVCAKHEDCGDNDDFCLSGFADSKFYCGASCLGDPECGSGNKCFDLGGGVRQCLPVNLDCTGTAPACTYDTDCAGGYVCRDGSCVTAPPPDCDGPEDCVPGYVCQDGVCVPDASPHLPICAECTGDEQCGWDDDRCVTAFPDGTPFADGKGYCGVSCGSVGDDCGPGYRCWDFSDKPSQCLPESMECRHCNPLDMSGCDAGTYCDGTGCSTGVCRPGEAGAKQLGEQCGSDTECQTIQCVRQLDRSFCSATCQTAGEEICPWPLTCQPLEYNACGYCSCAKGRMGDSCSGNSDCQSGGCFTLPDRSGRVCAMYCGGVIGCPGHYECQGSPDGILGCFPVLTRMGQPCGDGLPPCLGGWCDVDAGGICTRSCEGDCACPRDMHCEQNADGSKSCKKGGNLKSGCGSCALTGSGGDGDAAAAPAALRLLLLGLALLVLRRRGVRP